MLTTLLRAATGILTLAAVLATGPAQAANSQFTLAGSADSGPLAGMAFNGSFAYDTGALAAGFSGTIDLASFSLFFAGQTYDLAGADATAVAAFAGGAFMGLDVADVDSADPAARPNVVLVSGITGLAADAYLAYGGAGGLGGYGSYSISAVPEPASLALLLAGLGLVGTAARRRR